MAASSSARIFALDNTAYRLLDPDRVLDAVESLGFRSDCRILALNSYENRVYQIGIEDGPTLVAKFYRPGRWSEAAILEEHGFALELTEQELPVVAPLQIQDKTLHEHQGFRFALYPRRGGRWPDLDDPDKLERLGRLLGRIHAVGATGRFAHRPVLDPADMGERPRTWLLEQGFIPDYLQTAYASLTADLLERVRAAFLRAGSVQAIRLHGDCHPGNILWTDAGPHFVDLDDCRTGPALQDLWMLLSGDRSERTGQLAALLEGYQAFRDFDPRELHLLETLRTLRMLFYSAWLAQRWDDPAFPRAFPWFNTPRYWEEQVLGLREQAAALDEPPLAVWA